MDISVYANSKAITAAEQRKEIETIMKCEDCYYYGKPSDAPETAADECMYIPTEEDEDYTPPCQRE